MDVMYIKHKLRISLLLGLLALIAFGLWTDFNVLQEIFTGFEWNYFALIFGLTFLGYLLRFLKWEVFLRTIGIRISIKNSLMIFLSGMSMAITPGKAGEVLKSFLLKSSEKVDIARTAPVVFAERLTDLLAMIILAAWGITRFSTGGWFIVITSLMLLLTILLVQNKGFIQGIFIKFKKYPALSWISGRLEVLYESSNELLRFKTILYTTMISIVSWFLECLSFYFVLRGLDLNQSVLEAVFVFSFSSIAGALSMLPGGLGVTEASMTGLMMGLGIDHSKAVAAMIMGRFATLWFGVILGSTVLLINSKRWFYVKANNQIK
ncbi:lysylphosphatidylglycerol synthase transmembrane domain-containing protein [Alkalihalobacillus deserti]|uniref:lysylphosphatidylglycerol synthase transmembrane domain-containing protein n=1 Tax=Alkalihalobacillus deserti TaxID=2879466 RepID=UPI001D15233E|nr:lysylphosphatidylglycerol synthase transmembrane domain-containing protein [Alkalihalobacillus deserti]